MPWDNLVPYCVRSYRDLITKRQDLREQASDRVISAATGLAVLCSSGPLYASADTKTSEHVSKMDSLGCVALLRVYKSSRVCILYRHDRGKALYRNMVREIIPNAAPH